jgi:hypothetical protein
MSTKVVTYYSVWDIFSVDGLGPSTVLASFSSNEVATEYAVGRGNYKNDAHIAKETLVVFDTVEESLNYNDHAEKLKAINTLTPVQIKLLGLEAMQKSLETST